MKNKSKKKKIGCLIPILIAIILLVVITIAAVHSEETKAPFEQLVNQPLSDVIEKIDEMGYSAKYFYDNGKGNNDYTDTVKDVISKDKEQLDKYIITKYKNLDTDNKTVDLFINTKDNVQAQSEASEFENTLGHINACQAIEQYGNSEYPYGFKLHYVTDLQGYEVTGNNDTWKIKCSATITNASGQEEDVICEAKVTGTNDEPNVIEFSIY